MRACNFCLQKTYDSFGRTGNLRLSKRLWLKNAGSTGIGKGTTFVMARFKIPVEVFTLTTLTRPSLPGNTSRIRPIGQSRAWCVGIL
ncbi:hypothetical protein TNCV_2604701 [Trichonephila clavipes]|nr:hypothetical protein TNCV_2604701 [Trichonephila clavipes]